MLSSLRLHIYSCYQLLVMPRSGMAQFGGAASYVLDLPLDPRLGLWHNLGQVIGKVIA